MKITSACLMAVLVCSCQRVIDDPTLGRPEEPISPERREEVRKIISCSYHAGLDILRGPLSIKEVRKELAEEAKRAPRENGRVTYDPMVNELKAILKQGDELYFFRSDHRSWGELRGREGYVAIRGDKVTGSLVTEMN